MLDCFILYCHHPTPANNIEENGGITTYTHMLFRKFIVVRSISNDHTYPL